MIAIPKWVYAVVAVIVLLVAVQCYRSRNQDKTADKDVVTSEQVDSLFKALKAKSSHVDTVLNTIIIHDKALTNSANNLKHASDTAGRLLPDSSAMWKLRWQLVGMAYDTLNTAHSALLVVVDSLRTDRNRWHLVADSAVSTMDALRKDLAVARSGCKVIPFVPCLSRKQTLIVGLVGGAVAYSRFHK